MTEFSHIIFEVVIWFFLLYGAAVLVVYTWMGMYALGAVLRYKRENTFTDYSIVASNPNAPVFSIIAPAYNEGMTIVENVRSLLSLYYHNLEIIIVNDGSKDDSMQKLIEAYELESVTFFIQGQIPTSEVKGIYKSKNPAFRKLLVVDKFNGGKADALNVGVNVSGGEYLVCIDVDCILEQDAILKLAKPFLEQTDKKLIACGGVIRLANNCKIENGKVVEVNLPRTLIGKSQVLEYIRAFVLGRMAWSRASGLILISGAFGVFDRKIVLEVGGYDRKTVGEDMELVVRMRKYMEERKEPYEVINIPDPLCWTEAPETKEILTKQRNRWMRGTMETLWKHRRMIFNPRYGKLGMVSLPYWLFFEFLGPLIEFAGYIVFIVFVLLGIVNWPFFLILFALVISSGFLYSFYAILVDVVSRQVYTRPKDFVSLIGTALLEPFSFHPMIVKASVKGFVDYFKKSHSWGEMTRQGFNVDTRNLPFGKRIWIILQQGLRSYGSVAALLFGLFMLGVTAEALWYRYLYPENYTNQITISLFRTNTLFMLRFIFGFGLIYLLVYLIKAAWARTLAVWGLAAVVIFQFVLFTYFAESHNLLGADIQYYTKEELQQTLEASGMLNFTNTALAILMVLLFLPPFWIVARRPFRHYAAGIAILFIGLMAFLVPKHPKDQTHTSEFEESASKSKWDYFLSSNVDDFIGQHPELAALTGESNDFGNTAAMLNPDFPFLKKENTRDFLGSYMNKAEQPPNLVLVILEGMGHAYTSPQGYIGNFTPFIDSLSQKSLYWENALSTAGRTFGAVPSLTGSLPFGKSGFLEIDQTPEHFNLYNVLKSNGFDTGFFYGGQVTFDKMDRYLKYSKVDKIIGEGMYRGNYQKLPAQNGESWGYDDGSVYRKLLADQPLQSRPYFNTVLTLSSHSPFLINNEAKYRRIFSELLNSGKLTAEQHRWASMHQKQLIATLYTDDALRGFFAQYKNRPDFANTIFIVTGDHSMPEITLQSRIDRYRVPLMIYSPLLKQAKTFKKIASHFDVAPTLLAFYRENYKLHTPNTVTWVGNGFTEDLDRSVTGVPIKKSKDMLNNYVYGRYHLEGNSLYQLTNMNEDAVSDPGKKKEVESKFSDFKARNARFISSQKLMPDSVKANYLKGFK